eukprot:COSAG02_NODE_74846_length_153_cov_36.814815_1_plen_23_part_10
MATNIAFSEEVNQVRLHTVHTCF